MKSLDPGVNHVLEQLRVLDPERATRLEAAIAADRAEARDAEFALVDLADAAQRMVVELHPGTTAREYVRDTIAQNMIPGRSAETRRAVAYRFLARATDHAAFEASGQGPEHFLSDYNLKQHLQERDVEAGHMEGLRILREALKLARAEEVPDV